MTGLKKLIRQRDELDERIRHLQAGRPTIKPFIEWTIVLNNLELDTKHIHETGRPLKDHEHYVYEALIEAVYGNKYWDWYNALVTGE